MIRLEKIAQSPEEITPKEPEKPNVADEHRDFITYCGRHFEVPTNMLNYLRNIPKNIRSSNRLSIELGLMERGEDGRFGCFYCNHLESNPIKAAMESGDVVIANMSGTPGIDVEGCNYGGIKDKPLRYTSRFTGPKGQVVDAWTTPCAVYDADMICLVTTGQLDQYEVKELKEFSEIKALIHNYKSKKVISRKPRSSLSKASLIIRNWFR